MAINIAFYINTLCAMRLTLPNFVRDAAKVGVIVVGQDRDDTPETAAELPRFQPWFDPAEPSVVRGGEFVGSRRRMVNGGTAAVLVLLTLLPVAALAEGPAKEPAVSRVNGTVAVSGGAADGAGLGLGGGSFTVPLGTRFGVQGDVAGGRIGGEPALAGGGHLFWRDPAVALAGVTAARLRLNDLDINRVGLEAEYYLSSLTVAASAGWQGGDLPDTGYGSLSLRWYVEDDLLLEAGGTGFDDTGLGFGRVEWQPAPLSNALGLTLFVEGGVGSQGTDYGLAGLRWYWGAAAKPLIRRHREDDPVNPLLAALPHLQRAVDRTLANRTVRRQTEPETQAAETPQTATAETDTASSSNTIPAPSGPSGVGGQ